MACDLITVSESYWRIVKFSVTLTVTKLKLWINRIYFFKYDPTKQLQYRPSVILNEFFTFFFSEIEKNCFEEKQCILELTTWCQLTCNIIINKYMPKIVSSSI